MKEKIQELKALIPKLHVNSQSFAWNLVDAFNKYGKLTVNQAPWVDKLILRATQADYAAHAEGTEPLPNTENVGEFSKVLDLFAVAKQHLKFPKIKLSCMGIDVFLSVAGKASKLPGSITIVGGGQYPNREWFGSITAEGVWKKSLKTNPTVAQNLSQLLKEFGQNPAAVAKKYGSLTGNCCFCGSPLTDPKSTAAGFGPVCADHYGLKAQWKAAAGVLSAKEKLGDVGLPAEYAESYKSFSESVNKYKQEADKMIDFAKANGVQVKNGFELAASLLETQAQQSKEVCYLCETNPGTNKKDGFPVCDSCMMELV